MGVIGTDWSKRISAGARAWSCVCQSDNGKIVIAGVAGGYLYISTNYGYSFTEITTAGSATWVAIACSSNGAIIYAAANNDYIYYSNDTGATWTAQTSSGQRAWRGICCTAAGPKAYASFTGTPGQLCVSTADNGTTWTVRSNGTTTNWLVRGITCNRGAVPNDGKIVIIASYRNTNTQQLIKSQDWGVNFNVFHNPDNTSGGYFVDVFCERNGAGVIAVNAIPGGNSCIYTADAVSFPPPVTWTKVSTADPGDYFTACSATTVSSDDVDRCRIAGGNSIIVSIDNGAFTKPTAMIDQTIVDVYMAGVGDWCAAVTSRDGETVNPGFIWISPTPPEPLVTYDKIEQTILDPTLINASPVKQIPDFTVKSKNY